jgi:hypothetical protein
MSETTSSLVSSILEYVDVHALYLSDFIPILLLTALLLLRNALKLPTNANT